VPRIVIDGLNYSLHSSMAEEDLEAYDHEPRCLICLYTFSICRRHLFGAMAMFAFTPY
jgi:hypothetical protein